MRAISLLILFLIFLPHTAQYVMNAQTHLSTRCLIQKAECTQVQLSNTLTLTPNLKRHLALEDNMTSILATLCKFYLKVPNTP